MRIRNLWKKIKCKSYEFNSILIKYHDPLLGYYIELIKETFKKNANYKSTFLYLFHSKILTYYSTHSSLHSTVLVSNFKFHESRPFTHMYTWNLLTCTNSWLGWEKRQYTTSHLDGFRFTLILQTTLGQPGEGIIIIMIYTAIITITIVM